MSTISRVSRFAAVLGLTALFAGVVSLAPARADDARDRHIHYDVEMLHREKAHLQDLYHRRDDLKRHHDWDGVRRVNAAITDTRWRIDHTQFDLKHDYDHFYSDRDRDWFMHHH